MDLKFTVDRKQNVNVQQPTKYEHARWTFCHTQRNCRERMSHVETHVRRTCAVDEVQPRSTKPQHWSKTAYRFSNHTAEICFNVREIIQIKVVLV